MNAAHQDIAEFLIVKLLRLIQLDQLLTHLYSILKHLRETDNRMQTNGLIS